MGSGIHFLRLITIETGNQHSRDDRKKNITGTHFSKMDKLKDIRSEENAYFILLTKSIHIYISFKYTDNSHVKSKKYNKLVNVTGEGNGTPLQHSCLENPMYRGAWKTAVQGDRRAHV